MKFVPRQDKNDFDLRLKFGKCLFLFLFFIVFIFLFKIQVIDYSVYSLKDRKTKYERVKTSVCRGTIYDRNGKILAMSVPVYSAGINTWMINHLMEKNPVSVEKVKKKICAVLNINRKFLEERIKKPYAILKENLSVEEYKKIKKEKIKCLYFVKSYRRVYPEGRHCCHILGFTDKDGNGLEGIELYYDDLLKGRKGVSLCLKDGEGNLIPSIKKVLLPPEEGKDLYLTIDSNIQYIVEDEIKKGMEEFKAKSVSAIVMNPETGEVLAMANLPDYDPNCPGEFPASFRRNRCITDLFEPGSVFKIVTATAAIEENLFSPDDEIFCENGKFFIRGHYLHDVHKYKKLSFQDVIVKSSNIGTVKIALSLGEEKLYKYCERFGFGKKTGIDLPGEIKGIFRPLERWSDYSITAVPIGQEVGITSIQGIRAMAVICNGGYLITPHILRKAVFHNGELFFRSSIRKRKVISEKSCRIIKEALWRVVSPEGTAPLAHIEGYKIYGKTGTAQKAENGRYIPGKYYASFIGFISRGKKKVIIGVNVDEPHPFHYGGVVAGPIFKRIMWKVLQYWDIPPDNNLEKEMKIALEGKNET